MVLIVSMQVTMFNLQKLVLRKEADAQALRTETEAAMARQKKHAAAISVGT